MKKNIAVALAFLAFAGCVDDGTDGPDDDRSVSLSPEARERIKKALRDYLDVNAGKTDESKNIDNGNLGN